MPDRTTHIGRHEANHGLGEDLQRWKQVVRELPIVRVEKVVAVRAALRHHGYDTPHIVAETVARMSNDVGVLARR